jgi:hypothetical protein
MGTRRWLLVLIAFTGSTLLAWIAYRMVTPGIQVIVINQGPDVLQDVTVHVTGASYDIGNLSPGESKQVGVSPTGESDVFIEFTDKQEKQFRLTVGRYIEPAYRGTLRVDIKDNQIESVKGKADPSIY